MYFDHAGVRQQEEQGLGKEVPETPGLEPGGLAEIIPVQGWRVRGVWRPDETSRVGATPAGRMIFTRGDPGRVLKALGRD